MRIGLEDKTKLEILLSFMGIDTVFEVGSNPILSAILKISGLCLIFSSNSEGMRTRI